MLRSELAIHLLQMNSDTYFSYRDAEGSVDIDEAAEEISFAARAIKSTINTIDVSDKINPLKVLGVPCDVSLSISIISTVFTVYFSIYQYASSFESSTTNTSNLPQ